MVISQGGILVEHTYGWNKVGGVLLFSQLDDKGLKSLTESFQIQLRFGSNTTKRFKLWIKTCTNS